MSSSIYFILILFLSFSTPSTSRPCSETIHKLNLFTACLTRAKVTNFTTFHNSSTPYYTFLNYSLYNLRFTDPSLQKPLSIVLPSSPDQIWHTVICATSNSLALKVRSGGHSYEGASSVSKQRRSHFIVIDMMNMDRVTVDLKSNTAWVEGGATLGQVYKAIADVSDVHGFSAGSCPTVGVGGHISGGGFGLMSRKYGLAADNVVDVILIDGYARVLNRSAIGEDVFWALRGGGGGGWGIIAGWKIKLQEVPKTVTSFVVTRHGTKAYLADLVDKWQAVGPILPDEFYLSATVGSGLPGCEPGLCVSFKGLYLGPIEDALLFMTRMFPGLGVTRPDCIQTSWIESVLFFSGLDKQSNVTALSNRYSKDKHYFKAKSDYVRSPISPQGLQTMLSVLELEPKGYVILDPYGGAMARIPSDSIAFPHRSGNLYSIQYLVEWKADEDHKRDIYLEWIRKFYIVMEGFVSKSPRAAYVNYLDYDLGVMEDVKVEGVVHGGEMMDDVEKARSWGERYFLKNYDRLVQAKTEMDPENFFWTEQGIPPLASSQRARRIPDADISSRKRSPQKTNLLWKRTLELISK